MSTTANSYPTQPARGLSSILTPQFTLLVFVALVLVTIEGLTRGSSIAYGGEAGDTDILDFGQVFAWIILPFVLMYANSVRIRLSEGLLLWLLLGSVVYDKSFAYTHIPGLPIFVTDIVLAICCFDLWKTQRLAWNEIPRSAWIILGIFVAAGCLAAARGVLGGQDRTKIARDFALVLYTVFILVAASIFRSWASIRRYLAIGALGGVLATVNAFLWFSTVSNLRRYIPSPVYVETVFVAAVLLKIRGWKGWKCNTVIALSAIGLLLGNARSTDLIAVVALGAGFIASAFLWKGVSKSLLKTAALVLLSAMVLVGLAAQTEAGHKFIQRNIDDIVSGIHYQGDDNAMFRLLAWAEAYRRFSENPAIGEGYGIPFVFELADNDPRPHNTYLTVLYKMGIVGFLPLAAILFEYYRRSIGALSRYRSLPRSVWLLLLVSIQFSFCSYGALNLLLESPFLASLFWINIGMTLSAIALLRKEQAMAV